MVKIKEIFAASFGKLQNHRQTLDDGLNVISGENGCGKTTLAAFVKAVFFGMGGKKGDVRRKYTPWESTAKFGGYIVFEANGKTYRAERYFGKTPAGDEFRLFDGNGAPCFDFDENLGEQLFDIDADSFERCLYVPQKDVQITANDTFLTKLGKMVDYTDDKNNFETACKRLEEYQRSLVSGARSKNVSLKTREETKLRDAQENLQQRRRDVMLAETKKAERQTLDMQEEQLQKDLAALKEKQKQFEAQKALQANAQVYLRVKGDHDKAKAAYDALKEKRADVDDGYILRLEEEIKRCESAKSGAKPPVKKTAPFVLYGFAMAIVIAAAVLFGTAGAVAGVCCLCVGLMGIAAATGAYLSASRKQRAQRQEENALAEAQNKLKEEFALHKIYEDNFYAALTQLKNDKKAFDEAKAAYNAAAAEYDAKSKDPTYVYAPPAAEDFSRRIGEKEKILTEVTRQNARMGAEIDALLRSSEQVSDLQNVIDGCQKRIEELNEEARLAELAKSCLERAKSNLSCNFMPAIKTAFEKYMSFITAGQYQSASVDETFALRLEEKNSFREFDYFSKGITDIGTFCLRLALIDAMFGAPPLLMLDDPFVNYDGKKKQKALQLLKDRAKTCQILYLTCKDE